MQALSPANRSPSRFGYTADGRRLGIHRASAKKARVGNPLQDDILPHKVLD